MAASRRAVTGGNARGASQMRPFGVVRRSFEITKLHSSRLDCPHLNQQRHLQYLCEQALVLGVGGGTGNICSL